MGYPVLKILDPGKLRLGDEVISQFIGNGGLKGLSKLNMEAVKLLGMQYFDGGSKGQMLAWGPRNSSDGLRLPLTMHFTLGADKDALIKLSNLFRLPMRKTPPINYDLSGLKYFGEYHPDEMNDAGYKLFGGGDESDVYYNPSDPEYLMKILHSPSDTEFKTTDDIINYALKQNKYNRIPFILPKYVTGYYTSGNRLYPAIRQKKIQPVFLDGDEASPIFPIVSQYVLPSFRAVQLNNGFEPIEFNGKFGLMPGYTDGKTILYDTHDFNYGLDDGYPMLFDYNVKEVNK